MEIGQRISGVCEGLRQCEEPLRGLDVWVISSQDGHGRIAILSNAQLDGKLCGLVGHLVEIVRAEDVRTRSGFRALNYVVRPVLPAVAPTVTDPIEDEHGRTPSAERLVRQVSALPSVCCEPSARITDDGSDGGASEDIQHVARLQRLLIEVKKLAPGGGTTRSETTATRASDDAAVDAAWRAAQRLVAKLDGLTVDQCRAHWIQNRFDVEEGRSPQHAMTPAQIAAAKQYDPLRRDLIHREGLRLLRDEAARRERDRVRVDLEIEPWE